jgi:hypothetical protein
MRCKSIYIVGLGQLAHFNSTNERKGESRKTGVRPAICAILNCCAPVIQPVKSEIARTAGLTLILGIFTASSEKIGMSHGCA